MPHWVTTNITKESFPFGENNIYDDARLIANGILNCDCERDDPDCKEFTMLVDTIYHDWQLPLDRQPIKWDYFDVGIQRAMKRAKEVMGSAVYE